MCIQNGWNSQGLPSHCSCGAQFNITHVFNCHIGAFPTIWHNRIHDLTAQFLTRVCPSVEVEPQLQPLSGETFPHQTTNLENNARLNVKALDSEEMRGNVHSLMCSTLLHCPMLTRPSNPPTKRMRRREGNLRSKSPTLSMALSHPW